MTTPLRIVWSWRARAIAAGLTALSALATVRAALDPKTAAWVVIAAGLLTAVCAYKTAEMLVYRVTVDAAGLRRRSLRGTDELPWHAVRGVRLVATRHEGMAIVHTLTLEYIESFHARLITDDRGARPWDFNAWMDGYRPLLRDIAGRELPPLVELRAPESPRVQRALDVLDTANAIGTQLVFGFALLFFLFIGSVAIVAGGHVRLTGRFGLDLVLVASALLGAAGLVDALVKLLGARRLVLDGVAVRERRTYWMANAASLIGGVLVLVAFVPRALAGGHPSGWVDWVLVAMGGIMVYGALRD